MQPSQLSYPEFVPDQVLTSSNLNDLFNYLDEQERLTRANLIGIGIVCGLEITTSSDGSQLTISEGCGITSGGYLITFPETTFTEYKIYNAVNPLYYEKFVDIPAKSQLYNLDQLFESGVTDGTAKLTAAYLKDKVVLLYVELLEDNAKNCDPTSCDDKGKNIDITFRPLLISSADAAKLKTASSGYDNSSFQTLPVLKMPRYNVPATLLSSSVSVLDEYRKILTQSFLTQVQTALTGTYNTLLPLINDLYPSNPFATISTDFSFLYDNSITGTEAINLQYYYDLFADIELVYGELREAGLEAFSLCCPDVNLFRLHLLLGSALGTDKVITDPNRQYFIPSPVMECDCKQTQKLRWLFQRIQLLLQNFQVAFGAKGNFTGFYEYMAFYNRTQNSTIKITPSNLGRYPLAKKAIPFYYLPTDGTYRLVDNWDPEKTAKGEALQNLSYNSNLYATDDFVLNPLNYDLEPYNFLRIEGHIGMSYATALKSIVNIRDSKRLPFDIVTLGTDLQSLKTALSSLGKTNTVAALLEQYSEQIKSQCKFQDLDAQFDTLMAEITCQLCKTMLYFYQISENVPANAQAALSVVPLVLKCNPQYMVQPATFGYQFEQFYTNNKSGSTYTSYAYYEIGFINEARSNATSYYFLLLAIEDFYETFTASLGTLDYTSFSNAYNNMLKIATDLRANLASQAANDTSINPMLAVLDRLIGYCILKQMESLYRDYLLRWVYVMMLQKFGFFIRKHPGIQHKAGVPMGGTFIMVYHESPQNQVSNSAPSAPTNLQAEVTGVKQKENVNIQTGTKAEFLKSVSAANSIKGSAIDQSITSGIDQNIYTTPVYNTGFITDINDLSIFKTGNPVNIDDLGILLQDAGISTGTPLTGALANISDGTVIADFYLPYLCSSECPPIQYTVTEVLPNITISITPAVFGSTDNTQYAITVTPDGGQVSGEGVSTDSTTGKSSFTPNTVKFGNATDKQKDVTLTYSAFGQSVTTKVTVYQVPTADFDVAPVANSDTVTLKNNSSAFADKYSWNFGDTQSSTDQNPQSHAYAQDGQYTITLQVMNNMFASNTASKTITVTTPDVTISMDKTAFCINDKGPYTIKSTPDGCTIAGEGVVASGAGFGFIPANTVPGIGANKTITLTATKGAKSKTMTVTIYQMPVVNFTTTPAPAAMTVLFNNTTNNADAYSWDFGNQSTSTEVNPTVTYKKAGTYSVTLTATNGGVCTAS
ncbi:MAG TPA: PKD domain-containing protein, partial [Mucilaginibacter sp.]|nr:PKD domain-containing protein [Mucilaginibacter sp.]